MSHSKGSTLPATCLEEFISIFIKFPLPSFYARGEPKEYKTLFLPSIWRDGHGFRDVTPINENTTFTRGELDSLKTCQDNLLSGKLLDEYFLKFINDPAAPIDVGSVDLLQWAALAQHYNHNQCHPTRLIDITRDPLVALYFAVESEPENNGFVYYFKDNFNDITPNKILKHGGTYLDVLEVSDPGDKHPCTPNDETLAVARTPFPNRRVEAQRGAFCWTRGIEFGCHKGSLIIEIPSDCKETILTELKRLNYDDYTLFPNEKINV